MELNISEMIERIKLITPLKMLDSIGISTGTISAWKTNNRPPRSDDLYKIAKYLNVSMEYLLTGEQSNDLPSDEAELLRNYRQLSDEMKSMIIIQIGALAAK